MLFVWVVYKEEDYFVLLFVVFGVVEGDMVMWVYYEIDFLGYVMVLSYWFD